MKQTNGVPQWSGYFPVPKYLDAAIRKRIESGEFSTRAEAIRSIMMRALFLPPSDAVLNALIDDVRREIFPNARDDNEIRHLIADILFFVLHDKETCARFIEYQKHPEKGLLSIVNPKHAEASS